MSELKISCKRTELLEALSKVSRAVPAQSAVREISGIKVTASSGRITMTGYDLSVGIVCEIAGDVSESGSVVIPPPFVEIVRKMTGEEISIVADPSNVILIESGKAKFDLFGFSSANYPELPVFADDLSFDMPQTVLRKLIRQTVFAASTSEGRPIQQGVLFRTENGKLTTVALDGFRMAVSSDVVEYDGDNKFVVPAKTLNEILRLLDDTGVIKLSVGKTHALFMTESYRIYTRLITQGEFVSYKSLITSGGNTAVRVNTRAFIESVEKVSLLLDSQTAKKMKSSIAVTFCENEIKLQSNTIVGKAQDSLPCKVSGPDIEIGLNNNYLLDALRAAESDEVVLKMTTPFAAIKIVPPDDDDSFIFLVMPVRTRNED